MLPVVVAGFAVHRSRGYQFCFGNRRCLLPLCRITLA